MRIALASRPVAILLVCWGMLGFTGCGRQPAEAPANPSNPPVAADPNGQRPPEAPDPQPQPKPTGETIPTPENRSTLWLTAEQLAAYAEDARPTPVHLRPDVVYGTARAGAAGPSRGDTYAHFAILPGEHRLVPLDALRKRNERIGWYDAENAVLISHTPFSWDWRPSDEAWVTFWNVATAAAPVEERRIRLAKPVSRILQYDHLSGEVVVEERLADTGEHARYTEGIMRKALRRDGRVRWQHDTTEDTEVYALFPRFGRLGFTVIGHRLSTASPFHKGRFEQPERTPLSRVELGSWRPVPDETFRTEDYAQPDGWSILSVNPDNTFALGVPAANVGTQESLLRISLTSSQKPFAAPKAGIEGIVWAGTFRARVLRSQNAPDSTQQYVFESVRVGNTEWTSGGAPQVLTLPSAGSLPSTRLATAKGNILCIADSPEDKAIRQFFYITFDGEQPRFSAFAANVGELFATPPARQLHVDYLAGPLGNWAAR